MPVLQVGKIVFHDVPKQVGWEQGGISDSRLLISTMSVGRGLPLLAAV